MSPPNTIILGNRSHKNLGGHKHSAHNTCFYIQAFNIKTQQVFIKPHKNFSFLIKNAFSSLMFQDWTQNDHLWSLVYYTIKKYFVMIPQIIMVVFSELRSLESPPPMFSYSIFVYKKIFIEYLLCAKYYSTCGNNAAKKSQ